MSFDRLHQLIRKTKNPTVAGLDARLEYIPPQLVKECMDKHGENLEGAAAAVLRYNMALLDALQGIVPAVKPQAAYYELLGWPGVKAMHDTIQYAHDKGFYVIADVKRGDIGSTAQAYAEGWLGKSKVGEQALSAFDADCVTINGYMGSDAILPFLDLAKEEDKGVFLLVKTSNPSSGELQDMVAGDRQVYTVMADLCKRLGAGTEGECGYQTLGAVVGATIPPSCGSCAAAWRRPSSWCLATAPREAPPRTWPEPLTATAGGRSSIPPGGSSALGRKRRTGRSVSRTPPVPPPRPCGMTSKST